jgi:hypothetical protein
MREWIADLHLQNSDHAISVGGLRFPRLASHFPENFLQGARVAAVGHVPFPPVSDYGLPEFEGMARMEMAGITFNNMYFVRRSSYTAESIHFHELVHVVQWSVLGLDEFLLTYALGVAQFGYLQSPLEAIAYGLQAQFENATAPPAMVDHIAHHAIAARHAAADVFRGHGLTMGA